MQFNAFRQMFKYDSKVAINVMHALDTSRQYAHVILGNDLKARTYRDFPQVLQQMDNITEELRESLQTFANRWKFFYGTDPQVLCAAFVKQQAFSRNPKNK